MVVSLMSDYRFSRMMPQKHVAESLARIHDFSQINRPCRNPGAAHTSHNYLKLFTSKNQYPLSMDNAFICLPSRIRPPCRNACAALACRLVQTIPGANRVSRAGNRFTAITAAAMPRPAFPQGSGCQTFPCFRHGSPRTRLKKTPRSRKREAAESQAPRPPADSPGAWNRHGSQ